MLSNCTYIIVHSEAQTLNWWNKKKNAVLTEGDGRRQSSGAQIVYFILTWTNLS